MYLVGYNISSLRSLSSMGGKAHPCLSYSSLYGHLTSGSVYWVLKLLLNFMEVSQKFFQEFNIIKSTALQLMLPIDDIVPEQCIKGSALA